MRRFRLIQSIVSIFLFILVFFVCWMTTGFDLLSIQLSHMGSRISPIPGLWNSIVCVLAMSAEFNILHWIHEHPRLKYKREYSILFTISLLSLFLTGVVPMDYLTHLPTALLYFFSMPLIIFGMSFMNRKHIAYREWKTHLTVSILMSIFPLIFLRVFNGEAIPEIIHAATFIYWNIYINISSIKSVS